MSLQTATTTNEDCNIRYFYQGSGPLLILIPGGEGSGRKYAFTFPVLSKNYTVATLDRRQNSGSTVPRQKPMNIAQQVRDVVAVMKALGFSKTSILGHSGGGIIALQMCVDYPELLESVILHEVPCFSILPRPESTQQMDEAYEMLDLYTQEGVRATGAKFDSKMIGVEGPMPKYSPELEAQTFKNLENFYNNEFLTFTIYSPDMRQVKDNVDSFSIKFATSGGERSAGAAYVRTMEEVAKIIGCDNITVPGSHYTWEFDPDALAEGFQKILTHLGRD